MEVFSSAWTGENAFQDSAQARSIGHSEFFQLKLILMQVEFANVLDKITSGRITGEDLNQSLCLVGDLLRDEENRRNLKVRESLPNLMKITNKYFNYDESSPSKDASFFSGYLRVLINATAGSDENRSKLVENSDSVKNFWVNIKGILALDELKQSNSNIIDRLVLLISQFCYETAQKEKYLTYLRSFDLHTCLLDYAKYKQTESDQMAFLDLCKEISIPIDVTNSLLKDSNISLTEYELENLSNSVDILSFICLNISEDDSKQEEVDDVILNLTSILFNLTSLECAYDENLLYFHASILKVLPYIPKQMPNYMVSKRNLFAASGNISSMKGYGTSEDMEIMLSLLGKLCVDSYALAAIYIALGNCIDNQEKQKILKTRIKDRFTTESIIQKLLNSDFNDIILYQSYHFFSNFMSVEVAKVILNNCSQVTYASEKIITHEKYYRNVASIFFKFIKKLIDCAFIKSDQLADIFAYLKLWDSIGGSSMEADVEGVFCLLLQGSRTKLYSLHLEGDQVSFVRRMICTLFSSHIFNEQVTIDHVLQKLKTLGIFFQVTTKNRLGALELINGMFNSDQAFFFNLLSSYLSLLERFESFISNEQLKACSLHKIYCNNLKFVCASTIAFIELTNSKQSARYDILLVLNDKCERLLKYLDNK